MVSVVNLHDRPICLGPHSFGDFQLERVFESRRFLLRLLEVRRRPLPRVVLFGEIDVPVVDLDLLYFKWLRFIRSLPEDILGLLRGAIRRPFLVGIDGSRSHRGSVLLLYG